MSEVDGDEQASASSAKGETEQLNGEDLFGSEDGDAPAAKTLDDATLDSGDDLDRDDRAAPPPGDDDVDDDTGVELRRNTAEIAAHVLPPNTADKELYLLKVPKFLSLEPAAFDREQFTPPTSDHHSRDRSAEFSAHKTAMKTIRWRRAPSDHTTLQSNARILRWSDGSLTLQLATDPTTQYLIPSKPLAPPPKDATKPSPSTQPKSRRANPEDLATYTYLTQPSLSSGILLTTAKLTSSLTVAPSQDASNDAIARLQTRLQQTKAENNPHGDMGGMGMTAQVIDPELAQRQAEQAEKEAEKLRRRRENQELKDKERANRVLGRRSGGGTQGLNVASLEDDDELGMGVRRRQPAKRRRANRTGEIYSDDEMEGPRGRTREDEYDEEDDFVAGSDEEEEVGEGYEDEDIDERIERAEARSGTKRKTPEEDEEEEEEEEEEQDAEGEPDEEVGKTSGAGRGADGSRDRGRDADVERDGDRDAEAEGGSPLARSKRRRVIDDDDDEEE
ncbi:MAG: hypothetical protein Q9162_003606 [Coniocarpon cinnabarinum]